MDEKVKVSVDYEDKQVDFSDKAAVIVTPSRKLIKVHCDGYDMLKLLAVLDSAMGDIIDRLKSVYHLSTDEICERIYKLKEVAEVQDQC
ncbi:MAG: hypothetical protein ACI4MQ_06735 [Candidatus Coproplasma sp.]